MHTQTVMSQSIAIGLSIAYADHPRRPVQNPRRPDSSCAVRAAVPRGRADGRVADRAVRGLAAGGFEASRRAEAGRAGARSTRRTPDPLQRPARRPDPFGRLDQRDEGLLAGQVRPPRRPVEKDGPMTSTVTETRSVVIEREVPYPPERIWRALTQPHLIEEWLMKNDFQAVADHRFKLTADWGAVDCRVMTVEPNKTLSYTWDAMGLESVVTW